MPIEQEQYWKTVCDQCGEAFPEDDWGGYMLSETLKGARETVDTYDGEIDDDGKVTCAGCIEERPAGDQTEGSE